MFNSTVLEVAIGLVLVYLVLSLLVTAANELVANWFRSRAKFLEQGIRSLLLDPTGTITASIYAHPLVRGLSRFNEKPAFSKPSYIPSATFAKALLERAGVTAAGVEAAAKEGEALVTTLPDGDLKAALSSLAAEAKGDFQKLKTNTEVWYDNTMERVSGWYKRKTQWVTLWLAFAVVLLLNVDSLKICHVLSNTPAVRTALAAEGEGLARRGQIRDVSQIEQEYGAVSSLGIPTGWAAGGRDFCDPSGGKFSVAATLQHLLGWLLSAVAASLGAPFWFDVLNRIINIRSAGRAPGDAPRSPSKAPPARTEGGSPV